MPPPAAHWNECAAQDAQHGGRDAHPTRNYPHSTVILQPNNQTKHQMKLKKLLTLGAALVLAGAAMAAEPIKIGYSDWPGWTAWEIAKVKGLFAKHGVDVKLVWFPIYTDSLNALNAGQV